MRKPTKAEALKFVLVIMSAYRSGSFQDPEAFSEQLALNFMAYPYDACVAVAHPVTGIQTWMKWQPTISEVCVELRGHTERLTREAAWRERYGDMPTQRAILLARKDELSEGVKRDVDAMLLEHPEWSRRKALVEVMKARCPELFHHEHLTIKAKRMEEADKAALEPGRPMPMLSQEALAVVAERVKKAVA